MEQRKITADRSVSDLPQLRGGEKTPIRMELIRAGNGFGILARNVPVRGSTREQLPIEAFDFLQFDMRPVGAEELEAVLEQTKREFGQSFVLTPLLMRTTGGIFDRGSVFKVEGALSETLSQLQQILKSRSDPKLLIVSGDGTSLSKNEQIAWGIGAKWERWEDISRSGKPAGEGWIGEDLNQVLRHPEIEEGEYTAIVVQNCNGGRLEPEPLKDTTVFYVKGNAGLTDMALGLTQPVMLPPKHSIASLSE
jgi:hypothetical protein